MKKQDLDNYFTTKYDTLLKTSKSKLFKNNKLYIEPEILLSNCYIYLDKLISESKIETYKQMESYIINFISKESYWQNGKTNKEEKVNDNFIKKDEFGFEFEIEDNIIDSDYDLNHKIELEKEYNKQKYAITVYRQQDFEKETIAKMYFDMGLTTSQAFAKHLNMYTKWGWQIINQMKKEIKTIYDNIDNGK